MSSAISLRKVVKRYKMVGVLAGLDLEIEAGEFLALTGPSGVGKTTVLNLIGGIDRIDDGEVVIDGQHLEKLTGNKLDDWRARHIGFVFQFYNLLPMLSAAANVELPLLLTHQSRAERKARVAAVLDTVGLSDRASHRPGELSGGQQQRVGIARAIVAQPPILLCDEPTGDLDRNTADDILKLLHTINRQYGTTIVMVTHDPLAAAHARRQLHFDKGTMADVVAG